VQRARASGLKFISARERGQPLPSRGVKFRPLILKRGTVQSGLSSLQSGLECQLPQASRTHAPKGAGAAWTNLVLQES
jgi:hypothetical protein